MKIRTRITLLAMGLTAAVAAAMAANLLWFEQRKAVAESSARIDALMEGVMRIARESLSSSDELMLLGYLKFLMRDYPELELALVSRQGHSSVIGAVRSQLFYRVVTVTEPHAAGFRETSLKPGSGSVPAASRGPLMPPQTMSLQMGFSKTALGRQVRAAQRSLAAKILAIAAIGLLLGLAGSFWVARLLATPVTRLAEAAKRIGEGDLDASVETGGRDEIAELARRFNTMAAKVRETIRFKEDLFSTLSHELNNPLGGLKGYLAFLSEADSPGAKSPFQDPAQRAEAYETMREAVGQMEVSLNNALALFKTGAQPALRRETVDLRGLADEALRLFGPAAQAAGVELRGPGHGEGALLHADKELLRRVVINLVSNALKYTPAGGSVTVSLEDLADGVRLKVADSGPGIAPEDRDKIFTKFYRAPGPGGRPQRIPGSGLGLAIAKQAVDLHGGRIWVESVMGKESVFQVSLPKLGGAHAPQKQAA